MTWQVRSKSKYKLLLIFLAIVSSMLVSCTNPAEDLAEREPAQPRSGILFTSDRTGNWDIFLIQSDGSGQVQVTDAPEVDADPDWSHDGRKIAFRSRRDGSSDIFVMNPDGSNPVNLINDPELSLDTSSPLTGIRMEKHFPSTRIASHPGAAVSAASTRWRCWFRRKESMKLISSIRSQVNSTHPPGHQMVDSLSSVQPAANPGFTFIYMTTKPGRQAV